MSSYPLSLEGRAGEGLLLLLTLILLYRFGRDGRGGLRFRGVVGLHIGGGGGDSTPSLAATDSKQDSTHNNGTSK